MRIPIFEIANRLSEIDFKFQKHVEMLLPILLKLDPNKISDKSGIEFDTSHLHLLIIPINYEYAFLNVCVENKYLSIGYAEGIQHEDFNYSAEYLDPEAIDKYLSGIVIKEYCNKNGTVIKRNYYYKDNTGIGSSRFFPFFAIKLKEKVISLSFYNDSD